MQWKLKPSGRECLKRLGTSWLELHFPQCPRRRCLARDYTARNAEARRNGGLRLRISKMQ
ncbi:hypothetical protein VULLAG_LOCUS13461 [Vulpes lagopus]